MDTDKLRLFVKIAETENLTKAAEELGYTQSGASHAIRSLEEELGGVKLFTRGRDGSLLTNAGRVAFSGIKEMLYWENQIKKDILKEINNVSVLKVGFVPSFAKTWMIPIIDQMNMRYPNVHIETIVGDNRMILQLLTNGELDCGFASPSKSSPVTARMLWDNPYVAVLSKNHPLANKKVVSLSELSKYNFVRTFWDVYDDIIREIRGLGYEFKINYSASQYSEIFEAIHNSDCISVVLSSFATVEPFGIKDCINDEFKGVVFRPLKERMSRSLGILVHNSKNVHCMVQPLCDISKELFESEIIGIPEIK